MASSIIALTFCVLATLVSPISLTTSSALAAQGASCAGAEFHSQTAAKKSYAAQCGLTYDSKSGFHKCDWVSFGWICSGPRAEGPRVEQPSQYPAGERPGGDPAFNPAVDPGALAAPKGLTAQLLNGDVARLEWNLDDDRIIGVNVYRDRQFMASVNRPVTNWIDPESGPGSTYHVTAYDDGGANFAESLPVRVAAPVITGTEHSYFTWTFDRIRTMSNIDDTERLKELVSALFAHYDPLTGNPGSKRSQKAQYNLNREIAWALLGVDAATNNDSCCGNLRLAFVWNNMLSLISDETAGIYKGASASDREFYESWNAATPRQRLDYLGIDADQWFKAAPFMEAAGVNLGTINDYKSAEFDQVTGILIGLGLSVLTVGALPPGTSVLVQGAVGGAVSAGASTLYISGDLEEAIKAAGEGAVWGGLAGWADELTGLEKVLGNVAVATVKAEVTGADSRVAALNALTGELIDGVAANVSFEAAEANALAQLTPVFGSATANKLVDFASATSVQLVSELTVLYLLDDEIDFSKEADRIILSQFAAAIGNETEDLIKPIGDHVSRVIGDLVETGINTDWDEDELQTTLGRSLSPVVAGWISALTPDGSDIEMVLLGAADKAAGLDETDNALALDGYLDTKKLAVTNFFKDYVNVLLGFELFTLEEAEEE